MAKREPHTLWHCISSRMTMIITCSACNRRRYYDPNDLLRVMGNVESRCVADRMRCETSKTGDFLCVDYRIMSAQERQAVRLRRLKEI